MHDVGLIYSDDFLKYDFGRSHPLNQVRLKLTFELLKSYGVTKNPHVKVFKPPLAKEEDVLLVHDKAYVDYVKKISAKEFEVGEYYRCGFGPGDNPVFENAFEASCFHVGGTLLAADLVMEKKVEHAFSIGGGYHHALRDRASGFCVFNDPAIAIKHLQKEYKLKRIMYIDVDAHHGDGVQWLFFDDPSVMTISLHESGRHLFPGTGFVEESGKDEAAGTKVNVPLPMDTTDGPYVYAFKEVVVPLVRSFKPEFILTQFGADAHEMDPLTHLALTTRSYLEVSKMFHELAHEVSNGRWICVTGGGYDVTACPRIWTVMFSQMAELKLEPHMPEEFIKLCDSMLGYKPQRELMDPERVLNDGELEHSMRTVEKVVDEIKAKIFPRHNL